MIAPGEGERRAQRGYVPQYDLGARLIYEALAAGRLNWVGLADRSAGGFDDIVLGLRDRIAAHQIKTSRDPEPFSIKAVLLGANKLLARMLDSRRRLWIIIFLHSNARGTPLVLDTPGLAKFAVRALPSRGARRFRS